MPKIERIDTEDSFETIFKIQIASNHHQEIRVWVWEADGVEQKLRNMTDVDIDNIRLAGGRKVVRGK